MTNQIAALEKLIDGLDDFIQEGCSARPEDKSHALSALETIRALMLNPPADVNISGECVKEKP